MSVRICAICSYFYPVIGGTEKQLERLLKELYKKGYRVSVLTQRISGLPRIEIKDGIFVYREIYAPKVGFLFGIFYLISVFIFLWKKRNSYDIIYCNILYLHTVPAIFVAKLFYKKVVVKIAGRGNFGDIVRMERIRGGKILLKICKKVDKFIAVSFKAKEELKGIGIRDSQILVIPNFVDVHKFHPVSNEERIRLRKKLSLSEDKKICVFVGRLSPEKGISYLIKSWQKVVDNYSNVILLIVGEGPLRESLEKQTSELNIQDTVKFLGKRDNVSEYLQASDIFVLPSLSEGLPNALLEAMSCGLPCIATKIGGCVDLIEDGKDGFLVEVKNTDELAKSLIRLIQDEEMARRFGSMAQRKVEENYAKEKIVNKFILLWESLHNKGSK